MNHYSVVKLKDTKYEVIQHIGQGQAGHVYKALDKDSGQILVVKIYSKDVRPNEVITEKRILSYLPPHPNVIRLHDYLEKSNHAYFFIDYGGKDLWEHLREVGGTLSVSDSLPLFKQMVEALLFCHHYKICHHDVKLENFVVDTNKVVRLIDFGFSRKYREQSNSSNFHCSPAYACLNVLQRVPYSPEKSDVFSLGVCFFRTLLGYFPFCDPEKDHLKTLVENLKRGEVGLPVNYSASMKLLLKGMLNVDEVKRYTIETVVQQLKVVSSNEKL
jgi:serine/threonine protein kinase